MAEIHVPVSDTKSLVEDFESEIRAQLDAVFSSGQLASGSLVVEAEEIFKEKQGVDHALMVANGTVALQGALRAHNIGQGDEVIVPAFSFNATLNTVLGAGATAVLVDIDPISFCMDPAEVENAITPSTKAIMPVHLFGHVADMQKLGTLVEDAGITILEDAAQAHGAIGLHGPAGSFGTAGFSFYPTKNIAAPEAGMITTNSQEVADTVRYWRNQGMGPVRYQYEMPDGTNARSNNVAAAFIIPQLVKLDSIVSARSANAAKLSEGLKDLPGIVIPKDANDRHAWHQYTIRVQGESGFSRDDLAAELAAHGIGSGVYYPRTMSDYPVYDDSKTQGRIRTLDTTHANKAADEVLSLPVHPYVSSEALDSIVEIVKDMVEKNVCE